MRNRTLIVLTALLALTAFSPSAIAEESTDVTITVEAPAKLLASHEPFFWTLTLTWEEASALGDGRATGLDLLDHIVEQESSTYTLSWYDLDGDGIAESAFVDEVNGVATDFTLLLAGYFWALYEDGESATVGIDHIALQPGTDLALVYTGYPVDA